MIFLMEAWWYLNLIGYKIAARRGLGMYDGRGLHLRHSQSGGIAQGPEFPVRLTNVITPHQLYEAMKGSNDHTNSDKV